MSFVQWEFLFLFLGAFALHWVVPTRRWQNGVLLVASFLFYGWVHPWWVLLLLFSAVLDFSMGQLMVRAPARKAWWLACSVAGNLAALAYFKYFNFFIEETISVLTAAGVSTNLHTLNIILPAGISFYTFQTMSYTLDVYRGELKPRTSFIDYLVFVSFFPQLIAGPIERAAHLLPQLEAPRIFRLEAARSGLNLAIWGAFKKVVLADTMAPYVDKVFALEDPAGPLVWAAVAGFMLQLYCDFSGYTDIARGAARMLGVDLVRNFDEPYLAATTPELWQRWHMSLSFWIRDYLLTPLLGSADIISVRRFVAAITATMVIMGIWHGAGWNFVLFGIYHAFWILFYVAAVRWMPGPLRRMPGGRMLAIAFHSVAVLMVGGLLFRVHSVERIWRYLAQNPFEATPDEWKVVVVMVGVLWALQTPLVLEHYARRYVLPRLSKSEWYLPAQTAAWAVYAVLMFVFYRSASNDFIYFQF